MTYTIRDEIIYDGFSIPHPKLKDGLLVMLRLYDKDNKKHEFILTCSAARDIATQLIAATGELAAARNLRHGGTKLTRLLEDDEYIA